MAAVIAGIVGSSSCTCRIPQPLVAVLTRSRLSLFADTKCTILYNLELVEGIL